MGRSFVVGINGSSMTIDAELPLSFFFHEDWEVCKSDREHLSELEKVINVNPDQFIKRFEKINVSVAGKFYADSKCEPLVTGRISKQQVVLLQDGEISKRVRTLICEQVNALEFCVQEKPIMWELLDFCLRKVCVLSAEEMMGVV